MATVKLTVRRRETTGKQAAKQLRAEGQIPGVLYGEKQDNVPLVVDARALRTALSTPFGRNVILQLGLDGESVTTRAVVRDMERDPVSRDVLHVDLQRISENRPITMHIPVVLVGESPAVKEGRGILDHTMRDLEVKCLPKDIPEHIEVDISSLEARHAIHVSDITVPDVELLDNPERPVVEVLQPTIFREPTEEGAEGEAVEGEAAEGETAEDGGSAEGSEGEGAQEEAAS
jgi:large subunit ribosomal protein L25